MRKYRIEKDSLGEVEVPHDCLWGAQTERSRTYFSIGHERMPQEMIYSYAIIKKAAALANYSQGRLAKNKADLITAVCDEILEGKHNDHFPLHVWMTGSGTQFNMNVNEVIANRASQLAKKPLGSKSPVHPNDDVNCSQSSNDSFPAAMHIAVLLKAKEELLPSLTLLIQSLDQKAKKWKKLVKLGRTHLQDATPLTLGQEFSGYVENLRQNQRYIEEALHVLYSLVLGGTAVGTGVTTLEGFDKIVAGKIAQITKLPFVTAKNKFALQGSHNGLVHFSGALKSLAVSLYKIVNDIRLLSSGPRAGFYELLLPSNEPGSSIMPGKMNPTQCEALSMIAVQVMANDLAISLGDGGGHLEMNVYKPLIIYNLLQSMTLLGDGCSNFEQFLVRGMEANVKKINEDVERSLMLVTALTPEIGYDKASEIAHYAMAHDLELKEAALVLGYVTEKQFDTLVHPYKMCFPDKN